MKAVAWQEKHFDKKFFEKVKKVAAYTLLGSIITIGAGAVYSSSAINNSHLITQTENPNNRKNHLHNFKSSNILEEGPNQSPAIVVNPSGQLSSVEPPGVCLDDTRLEEIILQLKRSSVLIDTDEGLGSGVIIARRGNETVILTNRHVVESETPGGDKRPVAAGQLEVHNDGMVAKVVRVLIAPNNMDLAIVIVREDIGPPVRQASVTIRRGTGVIAIGSPLGLEDSVSRGIVSNFIQRQTDSGFSYFAIQTDAAINPGNSGGGLFLASTGELLGVTSFKLKVSPFETAEGMSFVIPINTLNQFPIETWAQLPMAHATTQGGTPPPHSDAGVPTPSH